MRRTFLISMLALAASTLWAAPSVSLDRLVIKAGETKVVNIYLNNNGTDYKAMNCTVLIPDGLTFGLFDNNQYAQGTDRLTTHGIDTNILSDGKELRIIAASVQNDMIEGTEGAVLQFKVTADGDLDLNSSMSVGDVGLVKEDNNTDVISRKSSATVMRPGTLAEILDEGTRNKRYAIGEELTIAFVTNDGATLYAKDNNGFALKDVPPYTATTAQIENGTVVDNAAAFDQSNWIAVNLPEALTADQREQAVGCTVSDIVGVLNNKLNPMITADEMPTFGNEKTTVATNNYQPANFIEQSIYFLVPPKAQEYVTVCNAVYASGVFYMASNNATLNALNLDGAVQAEMDLYDGKTELTDNTVYELTAIVEALEERAAAPAAQVDPKVTLASTYYAIHPISAKLSNTSTGIDENRMAGRTLVNTIYYSPAGVASAQPFEGVNVIVKHFDDGSRQVLKVIY